MHLDELNKESHWWNGPSVLYQPVENYKGPQVWATEGRTTPKWGK